MVISNFRFVPPDHSIVPTDAIVRIAKLVDTLLTLEGQAAALDAQKALAIANLYETVVMFVERAKL